MGRKAFFSEQEVFDCADVIAADGKEVTATGLLASLGRGSLTTIYKHLASWQASRPAAVSKPVRIEIPEIVQTAFAAAWRVAVTDAGRESAVAREKAQQEVKFAQKQFEEALACIERLETETEADTEQIESLTKKLFDSEANLHRSETERAALSATADQQRQRIESDRSELERLRLELEAERQLRESLAKDQRAGDRVILERDEARKAATKFEQQAEQARKERDGALKESAELRGQTDALKIQNTELLLRLSPVPGQGKPNNKK